MARSTIIWLLVATLLVLAGAGLFAAATAVNGWDFTRLDTAAYETNTHAVTELFTGIQVETDTADIVLVPSSEEGCKVVCYELENAKHTVAVEKGILTIRVQDERTWHDYIGIQLGQPKVTIYLPEGAYEALTIHSDTGDVKIPKDFSFENLQITVSTGDISAEGLTAGSMALRVSTGKITLTDISCDGQLSTQVSTGDIFLINTICGSFISKGSTGDLVLRNLVARETMQIDRSTGHVEFDGCDAQEIFVNTDTGDVRGTLLSGKTFQVETDTGRVQVPQSVAGGLCQIKTNTGDVILSISGSTKNP